jgi:hypothetical protein
VVTGHLVPFAAFFVKPQPGASALLKTVLNPQGDDRNDASET